MRLSCERVNACGCVGCQSLIMAWYNGLQMCNKWWLILSQMKINERGRTSNKISFGSTKMTIANFKLCALTHRTWAITCNYFWTLFYESLSKMPSAWCGGGTMCDHWLTKIHYVSFVLHFSLLWTYLTFDRLVAVFITMKQVVSFWWICNFIIQWNGTVLTLYRREANVTLQTYAHATHSCICVVRNFAHIFID